LDHSTPFRLSFRNRTRSAANLYWKAAHPYAGANSNIGTINGSVVEDHDFAGCVAIVELERGSNQQWHLESTPCKFCRLHLIGLCRIPYSLYLSSTRECGSKEKRVLFYFTIDQYSLCPSDYKYVKIANEIVFKWVILRVLRANCFFNKITKTRLLLVRITKLCHSTIRQSANDNFIIGGWSSGIT
jgi:hypothetical protein